MAKKTYWTVLKAGPFGGTPSYYNTFESEAEVIAHFQSLPGFRSAEVNSDNPEFRTLRVRFERVLFPTETYFYREAEYDGFVKADFSEMEARVVGHITDIDYSASPPDWAHGQGPFVYPNRKRAERYEK